MPPRHDCVTGRACSSRVAWGRIIGRRRHACCEMEARLVGDERRWGAYQLSPPPPSTRRAGIIPACCFLSRETRVREGRLDGCSTRRGEQGQHHRAEARNEQRGARKARKVELHEHGAKDRRARLTAASRGRLTVLCTCFAHEKAGSSRLRNVPAASRPAGIPQVARSD